MTKGFGCFGDRPAATHIQRKDIVRIPGGDGGYLYPNKKQLADYVGFDVSNLGKAINSSKIAQFTDGCKVKKQVFATNGHQANMKLNSKTDKRIYFDNLKYKD